MKAILTISHTDYTTSLGGIEKVIMEHASVFMKEGYDVFHICPVSRPTTLKGHTISAKLLGYRVIKNGCVERDLCSPDEVDCTLRCVDLHTIIIHSLIGLNHKDVLMWLDSRRDIKTYFVIHDYKSVCDGHNLLKNKVKYCGSNGRHFTKCWNCRFYWSGFSSSRHYRHFIEKFNNIAYIFPSEVVRDIWHEVYSNIPSDRLRVLPHQVMEGGSVIPCHNNEKLKIAYIGYKSFNKGWSVFKELCLGDKTGKHEYLVLGKTDENLPGVNVIPVSFIKDGQDAMVKAIKNNKVDVALLWSPWPETYSYTLFESYVGGAYILTNPDSGNIIYWVNKENCGKVLRNVLELKEFVYSGSLERELKKDLSPRPKILVPNTEGIKLLIE